jgi:hypothetical protein
VVLNARWGYVDKEGEWVIPAEYEEGRGFSQGMAPVKLNGKWGFVSSKGIRLIPFRYDDAFSFAEDFAAVMVDGRYGFINRLGRMVIEPQYYSVWSFTEGRAAVGTLPEQEYNFDPMTVDRQRYDFYCDWSVIDKAGKSIVELDWHKPQRPFSNGLMPIRTGISTYDYIDLDGKQVTELNALKAGGFKEGYAWIRIPSKIAYIDTEGNVVWPPTY